MILVKQVSLSEVCVKWWGDIIPLRGASFNFPMQSASVSDVVVSIFHLVSDDISFREAYLMKLGEIVGVIRAVTVGLLIYSYLSDRTLHRIFILFISLCFELLKNRIIGVYIRILVVVIPLFWQVNSYFSKPYVFS